MPSQGPRPSAPGRTSSAPQPLRPQHPVRRPPPSTATASKFHRAPVNRVADETGLTAVFGQLDLDELEKENSARVPEQLLKQV